MFENCQVEQKLKLEQKLITTVLPLHYPKNFYKEKDVDEEPESDLVETNDFQMLSLKNLFQSHYSYVILFCLIQFRNYQAASFNILFLVVANFIWQR